MEELLQPLEVGALNKNQRADDRIQEAWRQNGAYANYWVEEGTQKVRTGDVDSGGNGDEEEKLCVQMPQGNPLHCVLT